MRRKGEKREEEKRERKREMDIREFGSSKVRWEEKREKFYRK